MRALAIVNPAAGHGRGKSRWDKASAGLGIESVLTTKPGEAASLARRALVDGYEAILAVGGDGTIGEVVDGYLSAPQPLRAKAALGTWPSGSGCDTARHFGLGGGAAALAALLRTPRVTRLDAGRVSFRADGRETARHFINVVTLGLGGEVARRVSKAGKRFGGKLTYLAHSIASVARAKPYRLALVVDGVAEAAALYHLLALANTSTTGGGMRIAPAADASDGRLDLVSVGDLSRPALLKRLPLVYAGLHLGQSGVHHRLVRRVEVRSEETVYLNVDGEAVGTLPAVFEILPGAVPFILPS